MQVVHMKDSAHCRACRAMNKGLDWMETAASQIGYSRLDDVVRVTAIAGFKALSPGLRSNGALAQ